VTWMGDTVIGLLHPGEMGAAVAGCLTARGHDVRWVSQGRGPATAARAAQAGLADAGTVAALARQAGIILSVCPPHAALDTAAAVAAAGFTGLYVDANAISPAAAREVQAAVERAGGRYVDGGIVGPPPAPGPMAPGGQGSAGSTRLYLAGGPAGGAAAGPAAQVAALFEGTALNPQILRNENPAGASALKMAYAAWTKGSAALLLAARALARAEGVEDSLLAEWSLSQPGLGGRSAGAARSAAGKGWRWAGEMEEISASMTADGLPGGFHQAAAEVFRAASHGAASDGAASAGTAPNGTASHRTASPDGADGPDDALIDAVLALLLAGGA
jgi:3-hydroxyisobutyrate dehydrogenase-like beta-hydroxyacid dehydrogenase